MPPTSYKRYPQQVRACILRAAEKAKDWKTVAALHDRGSSEKKIQVVHVAYLLSELAATPELTLVQMTELVEQTFDVRINRETVRRAMDAHRFTLKKLHRDVVNRNSDSNKGWSRRGHRAGQTSVASKGKNIHVIAVISSTGVTYQESQFDSFTSELANEFIRRFLRHIHVFEEPESAGTEMLKLGPYSPMLNPIENVLSVYKSVVKRFLARQRPAILRVPEGTTITEHRAGFLELAANPLFAEVVTPELCNRAFCHSLPHHQRALRFEDMQVGA
ncbi:hypothetical protein PHYSODRAFT_311228 [Phytophthora sojae]|uniref:Tc1-like transposase DDE domain-containing protein n=1 Tax=Phytophthora sojae (strain P6497) TaxID=1094619 RepID=G4YRY3_PHYSP|nr:hypothetical protein PHYSODRAFT_311228 [Phytophthora sojae]EGZ24120.1 hypothetical protein PHYSODRAFT_311228 [Phytophthora sojae]|eukprot:XP_009519408.1 hypothetical protein PHYSODRAFT_311228 [Phytophthora sojae]